MAFAGEPTKDRDQRRVSADQVQATMQQIHDHFQVEMRRSQALQVQSADSALIPAADIKEGSQVWLDT